jgi:hypothetical protein
LATLPPTFSCVGLNDSFEQLYQLTRRFWRYGQTEAVDGFFIATDREGPVVQNLERKERDFEASADAMAVHMRDLTVSAIRGGRSRPPTSAPIARWSCLHG